MIRLMPLDSEGMHAREGRHICGCRAQIRSRHGRAELVLLDHGLYRRLSDDFRLEYAALWRSLVFGDEAGIRSAAGALGAAESVQLFAGMLTMRPWDEVTRCAARMLLPASAACSLYISLDIVV